jgi:hypothetical protein
MNLNTVEDVRIRQLAQTLRSKGLAGSETEALRMATSMITTEAKANKFAEEHRSSMIKNYDVYRNGRVPRAETQSPPAEQPQAAPAPSWENEVTAQAHPAARQGPAPNHSYDGGRPQNLGQHNALSEMIGNVQNRFSNPLIEATRPVAVAEAPAVEESVHGQVVEALEEAPAAAAPAPAVAVEEEEHMVERSMEIHDHAPARAVSSFAEAHVSLSSVFNVHK